MRLAARGALGILLMGCGTLQAQQADTLAEVRVRQARSATGDVKINSFAPGQKVVRVDSATLARYRRESVAALLAQQLPVFVKTYGTNGPATLNFRGASAAQSLVLWDGIPLQQAALGLTDVALLPVSFADGMQVVYGGSASLLGSGNVGGALLLQSGVPRFDSAGSATVEAAAGGGSFGRLHAFAGGTLAKRRSAFAWKAFGEQTENDFPYRTAAGATARLGHSQLRWGGIQLTARALRRSGTWGGALWLQGADRQIPPALFESQSAKRQRDAALRLRGDWQLQRGDVIWSAKSAYLFDGLRYEDSLSRLQSDLAVHKVFAEAGRLYRGRGWQVLLFAPVQLAVTRLEGGDLATQKSIALAGAATRTAIGDRLTASASLRGEVIDGRKILLPGANAAWRVLPGLSLRANGQRTYRAPTLNERYFRPGGNSDLLPEQGWSADAGARWEGGAGAWRWTADATAFTRRIQDWILWFGGSIWTPHNIAVVRSRGGEGDASLSWTGAGWQVSGRASASRVEAQTMESRQPGDGSIGKQIPYTPRWNSRIGATLARPAWSIDWSLAYTGERYVTTDESLALAPYTTQHLAVTVRQRLKAVEMALLLRCDNLTDASYTVVSGRPAPGRNYSATLSFSAVGLTKPQTDR